MVLSGVFVLVALAFVALAFVALAFLARARVSTAVVMRPSAIVARPEASRVPLAPRASTIGRTGQDPAQHGVAESGIVGRRAGPR